MPIRHRIRWTIAAILSAAAASGCTSEIHRYIRFPDFMHPGPAGYQRAEAIEHDPFPQNDVGPEVVGGRPLGFQAGVTEVERMTMNAPPPPGLRPVVLPGLPTAPPAIVAPFPATSGYPAGPPPIVTTPFPPPAPVQSAPFIQQQRSPY